MFPTLTCVCISRGLGVARPAGSRTQNGFTGTRLEKSDTATVDPTPRGPLAVHAWPPLGVSASLLVRTRARPLARNVRPILPGYAEADNMRHPLHPGSACILKHHLCSLEGHLLAFNEQPDIEKGVGVGGRPLRAAGA